MQKEITLTYWYSWVVKKKHPRGSTQATIHPLAIILTAAQRALVSTIADCDPHTASFVFLILLLTQPLTHSLTNPFTPLLTPSFTHQCIHSLTLSYTHSLTQPFTTHIPGCCCSSFSHPTNFLFVPEVAPP